MCNRYWDLYECRWQDYSRPEETALAQLPDTLVPEPRAEAFPEVTEPPVSAPALSVG